LLLTPGVQLQNTQTSKTELLLTLQSSQESVGDRKASAYYERQEKVW